MVGRGHHRLWDTVRNQYPLTQNYHMLPRAGSAEGREENHIVWRKSHLQFFLKLKVVRIVSVCRRQFVLLCCCNHVSRLYASAFED